MIHSDSVLPNRGIRGAVLALTLGALLVPVTARGADLAKIGTTAITEGEVEVFAADAFREAKLQKAQADAAYAKQLHELREGATRQLVQDRLFEAEAKERGVSKEDLFAAEVAAKVAPVGDADVDQFYEQYKERMGGQSKEQLANDIREYLNRQRQSEVMGGFVGTLEKKFGVTYLIEPYRAAVSAVGGPTKGGAKAAVTIVEFSDFQCPVCAVVQPTLKAIADRYGDKVQIAFRQFPLDSIHPAARKAAEASLCAHEQGKFWELHDAMFGNQQALEIALLKAKAKELGIDSAKFDECVDSSRYAAEVQQDVEAGVVAGVGGTPTMFINGRPFEGGVPLEMLTAAIDEELAKK
jgi:protein-disulfide isomerase